MIITCGYGKRNKIVSARAWPRGASLMFVPCLQITASLSSLVAHQAYASLVYYIICTYRWDHAYSLGVGASAFSARAS